MNRPGAEVNRMRSMWDSIQYHTIPVDKMAAFVVSHSPWWLEDFCESEISDLEPKKDKRLSIEDVVNITRHPPKNIKDFRGVKSRNHAIVGFSHRKEKVRNMSPSTKSQMVKTGHYVPVRSNKFRGAAGRKEAPKSVDRFSVWFCMRRDGAVLLVGQKALIKKLENLDICFEAGVEPGSKEAIEMFSKPRGDQS